MAVPPGPPGPFDPPEPAEPVEPSEHSPTPPPPPAPSPGPYGRDPYGGQAPAGPVRGSRGPLVALAVAAAVLLLAAAAVLVVSLRTGDDPDDGASGRLKTPLLFQQVVAETPGACTGGGVPADDRSTCYRLATGMTVTSVRSIRAVPPGAGGGWRVAVTLERADAQAFAALSGKAAAAGAGAPGNRIAMVVDGSVVSAPAVTEAIPSGKVEITGAFTREEARRLVRRLTGGR